MWAPDEAEKYVTHVLHCLKFCMCHWLRLCTDGETITGARACNGPRESIGSLYVVAATSRSQQRRRPLSGHLPWFVSVESLTCQSSVESQRKLAVKLQRPLGAASSRRGRPLAGTEHSRCRLDTNSRFVSDGSSDQLGNVPRGNPLGWAHHPLGKRPPRWNTVGMQPHGCVYVARRPCVFPGLRPDRCGTASRASE